MTAGTAERSCPDEQLGTFMKLWLGTSYENQNVMAKTKLNVVLGKGVSFMCVVLAKGRFTGVRFPSEEGIFTSLKG